MVYTVLMTNENPLPEKPCEQNEKETGIIWKQCDARGGSGRSCGSACFISVCTTCCARLGNYIAVFRAFKESRRLWILCSCHLHPHTHACTHPNWCDLTTSEQMNKRGRHSTLHNTRANETVIKCVNVWSSLHRHVCVAMQMFVCECPRDRAGSSKWVHASVCVCVCLCVREQPLCADGINTPLLS